MRRKMNVVLKILILFFMIIMVFSGISIANTVTGIPVDPSRVKPDPPSADLDSVIGVILGVIRVIGAVVMVATIVIIGIKYIMTSVEGKADLKKVAIPYLIGAILLFAGTQFVGIIYNFADELNNM